MKNMMSKNSEKDFCNSSIQTPLVIGGDDDQISINLNNYDTEPFYENLKFAEENIYENLCENCGKIFSGEKCLLCNYNFTSTSNNKTSTVDRKKNKLFSGIFLTLRQQLKEKGTGTVPKKKIKKIDIVHNVDGFDNVFKTKKTFNLTEICLLKNLEDKTLRKSDDFLLRNKNIFSRNFQRERDLTTKSSPNLNFRSTSPISLNFYQNLTFKKSIDSNIYTDILPIADVIKNDSLKHWMMSLRYQQEDYNENTISNVKSIPAFNSCKYFKVKSPEISQDYYRLVEEFQMDLLDNQVKLRGGNCRKDRKKIEPILIKWKDNQFEQKSEFVTEFLTIFDTFLEEVKPQAQQKSLYQKNTEILNKFYLSIFVNKVILTYDKNFKIILQSINKAQTIKTQQIFTILYIHLIRKERKKLNKKKMFDKKLIKNQNNKKTLLDFEIKNKKIYKTQKSIEDFQLPIPIGCLKNKLSDFDLRKIPHKKPTTTNKNEDEAIQLENKSLETSTIQLRNNDEENIYQSIWKFRTIGAPRESYTSEIYNNCDEDDEEYDDPDESEWEVADEFSFSKKIEPNNNSSPYQKIFIYYNFKNANLNSILYDLNDLNNKFNYINRNSFKCVNFIENEKKICVKTNSCDGFNNIELPDCIQAWKYMLLNVDYIEDEEDVVSWYYFFII